tara:strand:+ start:148 stop:1041 length:894 start_codon:yes stop_codon:yes gene_type:complete
MRYTGIIGCLLWGLCSQAQLADFDLQGHRGARGNYPENTISAMFFAIQSGVNTLEMDVVITGDMKVLLSHEPFFSHEICRSIMGEEITADNDHDFNIYMMTYAKTRHFECGIKGNLRFKKQERLAQFKPLLVDVLNRVYYLCDSLDLELPALNIEIKSKPEWDNLYHPKPDVYAKLLVDDLVYMKYPIDKITIQSFDVRPLQYLHKEFPAYKLSLLSESEELGYKKQLKRLGFTPDIYSPLYTLLNEKDIKGLHKRHVKVIPWTVNDTEIAENLIKLGVDGIITDYPAMMRKFINQQ